MDWLRRKRLSVVLVVVALASGCTNSHPGTATSPAANRLVFAHGGSVVVAVSSLPSNFNPSAPEGANRITSEVMAQVWPQTFVTDNELSSTAEEGFVEQAEVEGVSPFKVVYTLNPKAVWSDGVPIGVDDFIYNWHEQLIWGAQLPDAGLLAGYKAISSITSPNGGSTVEVTFSRPFTEWESLFSNLVPAHVGERYGWVDAFEGFNPGRVISGGPFEVSSYVPGVSLVLSRNPRYWFTPARLSRIVLEVQSVPQALANLQVGLVNIAQVPDTGEVAAVIASAAREGIPLTRNTTELPTLWQLCFNTTAPVVDAEQFRIGIAESLYLGEVTDDSVGLIDASAVPYESRLTLGGQSGPGSAGLGAASSGAGSSGGAGASSGGAYDPSAALTSFESAGYVVGPDGALRAGDTGAFVTLSLLVPSGDLAVEQAASVVQAELSAVGIRVILHEVSLKTMLGTTLPTGAYQMALAPFSLTTFAAAQVPIYSGSVLPATPTIPPVHPSTPAVSGVGSEAIVSGVEPGAVAAGVVTRDVSGLDDPTVETDLSDALTNLDPANDTNFINAADIELWLDVPTIPLFQEPIDLVHSSSVRAISESQTWAGVFWNAQAWEIQVSPPIVARSEPPVSAQPGPAVTAQPGGS